ncbi:MAG: hypothetical protein ACXWF9_13485 [Solirubrobacterales bacterium]
MEKTQEFGCARRQRSHNKATLVLVLNAVVCAETCETPARDEG